MIEPIELLECEIFSLKQSKGKIWRITEETTRKYDDLIQKYEEAVKILSGNTVKLVKVCLDPKWKNCGYIYRGIGCNNCPKFGYKPE